MEPLWSQRRKHWSLGQIVSYILQMNFAGMCKCVNASLSLKSWSINLVLHWMVFSSMPDPIWYCTFVSNTRRLLIIEVVSTLLTSDTLDLVQPETETDSKSAVTAAANFYPYWIYCHYFHWDTHPVMQKCKLQSWCPVGTQGKSSIGKTTELVDGVQQQIFLG